MVSGNYSFSLDTVGIGHRSQHLRIKSKLPLKLYVGVNPIKEEKIVINNVSFYDIHSNSFIEESFSLIHKQEQEILDIIYNFLQENNHKGGVSISILSEDIRGHGLGFSGLFGACLSVSLHILLNMLDQTLLADTVGFERSDVFQSVLLLGQKIDFVARHKNLGVNSIYPLLTSSLPYIFYSQKFDTNIEMSDINKIKYQYFPIDKLFEGKDFIKDIPIDYALVFTGQKQKTDIVEHSIKYDKNQCDNLSGFIDKELLSDCNFKDDVEFSIFKDKSSIYEHFSHTAALMGVKMLNYMKRLYLEGFNIENINNFIDQINMLRNTLSFVEKQEDFAEDMSFYLKKNDEHNMVKIGIKPIYSGKDGGSYILAMKEGVGRICFEKTINDLKLKYPHLSVIYASWLDGVNSDGVILHQYISKGIFSKFVNKNQVFVKTNVGESRMRDYNEVISSMDDGLLLDTLKNKIYLNGRKLNSSDIPSQTTTIALLDKLLDNIGKDIPNSELEISSYSKNKNEMIGKIVIPIIELLDKNCNYKLPLICKGSIYDFYVKLNPIDIKISIIKKI